ncbi:hypothetical protein C6C15_02420 [Microbacterium sp. str. 'China']|nr:hypothetical protein C6C15_02420 [Microbacterium sp. str. 'China']
MVCRGVSSRASARQQSRAIPPETTNASSGQGRRNATGAITAATMLSTAVPAMSRAEESSTTAVMRSGCSSPTDSGMAPRTVHRLVMKCL